MRSSTEPGFVSRVSEPAAIACPYFSATSGCASLNLTTSSRLRTVVAWMVLLEALTPGPKSLLARYELRSRLKPNISTVEHGGIAPGGVALRAATSDAVTQVP